MLIQAALIVDNACQILTNPESTIEFKIAALKCIESISDVGIGLPIQYMLIIEKESTNEKCLKIVKKIFEKQGKF